MNPIIKLNDIINVLTIKDFYKFNLYVYGINNKPIVFKANAINDRTEGLIIFFNNDNLGINGKTCINKNQHVCVCMYESSYPLKYKKMYYNIKKYIQTVITNRILIYI